MKGFKDFKARVTRASHNLFNFEDGVQSNLLMNDDLTGNDVWHDPAHRHSTTGTRQSIEADTALALTSANHRLNDKQRSPTKRVSIANVITSNAQRLTAFYPTGTTAGTT
eukprot:Lankesteria_metandrocarpae@DN7309_c0_g1_i1.p1